MLHSLVYRLRIYRRLHKFLSIALAIVIFISSLTGILLAWKKNADLLQPTTRSGVSTDVKTWKGFAELHRLAQHALDSATQTTGNKIDRIEGRPQNGIVKVLFKKGYWDVQLDATTGELLSVQRRHSDWIERLHDGSIVSDGFKLVSMNVLGFGLILMIFTGFWLWCGPKVIRRSKF
jgi:uncharacterized iron-regulated membrane protein